MRRTSRTTPEKAPSSPADAPAVPLDAALRLSLTKPEHAALETMAAADGIDPSDLATRIVRQWLRASPLGIVLDLAPELLVSDSRSANARELGDVEIRARLRLAADQGDGRLIDACRAALAGDVRAREVVAAVLEREADQTATG